jgi:hypothetical protein
MSGRTRHGFMVAAVAAVVVAAGGIALAANLVLLAQTHDPSSLGQLSPALALGIPAPATRPRATRTPGVHLGTAGTGTATAATAGTGTARPAVSRAAARGSKPERAPSSQQGAPQDD